MATFRDGRVPRPPQGEGLAYEALSRLRHCRHDDHPEPRARLCARRVDCCGARHLLRRRRLLRGVPHSQHVPPAVCRRCFRLGVHSAIRQAPSRRRARCRAHVCRTGNVWLGRTARGGHGAGRDRHAVADAAPGARLLERSREVRARRAAGAHRASVSRFHVGGRALYRRSKRLRPLRRRRLRAHAAQRRAHCRAARLHCLGQRRPKRGRRGAGLGHCRSLGWCR